MNTDRALLEQAQLLLQRGEAGVLVTVSRVRGSTPREAGARMLVSHAGATGTIGGGELEYQAIQQARALLNKPSDAASVERQFTLGSQCGQCCGGVAWLRFDHLDQLSQQIREALEQLTPRARVAVFGAGHVGRAVVDLLMKLDLEVVWVDARPDFLDNPVAAQHDVNLLLAPQHDPAAFARRLPPDTLCLVMTHSHSLDFDICSRLLERDDIPFCGLIGSASKRRRFERLLRQAGLGERIERLTCPIGVDGIRGKTPYEIAVGVSAQLLSLLDRASESARNRTGDAAVRS